MPTLGERREVLKGYENLATSRGSPVRDGDTFTVSHIDKPDSIGIGCLFDRELYPGGGTWWCGGIGAPNHRYYMNRWTFREFTRAIEDKISWEV